MFGPRLDVVARAGLMVGLTWAAAACSNPGPYGYTQVYAPLDGELQAGEGSVPFDPAAARRKPSAWIGKRVTLFGVVTDVAAPSAANPLLEVNVSLRELQPRNLCQSGDDDSCRVTVSETEFGQLHVQLLPASIVPAAERVTPGSLLHVVGTVQAPDLSAPTAEPMDLPNVQATFARHWPLQTYVTTSARSIMRR